MREEGRDPLKELEEEASRDEFRGRMEREDWPSKVFAHVVIYVVTACLGAILVGLAVSIPWLGIPLSIMAVIALWLFW